MSEEQFVPTSLDVVMGGEVVDAPVVTAEPEVEATPEPEAVEEKPNETEETAKAEESEEPSQVDNFAQLREVTKTQKARIAELEASQKEPEAAIDVFEDQAGFTQQLESKFDNKLLSMSEEMVKEQFDDYDAMLERVVKEAETNPSIRGNIAGKQNVALAVYKEGKRLTELDAIGDPTTYREKIRAEIQAEMKVDADKAQKTKTKIKDSLPDDLTSEGSTRNSPKDKPFEPTSLDAIL